MDEPRFVVSDVLWRRLEPHLPGQSSDCGVPAEDDRLFLEAVFWCERRDPTKSKPENPTRLRQGSL